MTSVTDQGQVLLPRIDVRVLISAKELSLVGNIPQSIVVISARPLCSTTVMKMIMVSTIVPSPMINATVIACVDCAPLGDAECEQCQKLRLCAHEGSEQTRALAGTPSVSQVSCFL